MVAIEVQGYGDFEMPYTHSVWVNAEFNTFNMNVLPDASLHRDPNEIIKVLKEYGFVELKTKTVTFGGAY
jgi:hypothetical protein